MELDHATILRSSTAKVQQAKESEWSQFLTGSLGDGQAKSRLPSTASSVVEVVKAPSVKKVKAGYLKVAGEGGSRAGSFTTTIYDDVAAPACSTPPPAAVIREEDHVGVVPTYDVAGDGMLNSDGEKRESRVTAAGEATTDHSIDL